MDLYDFNAFDDSNDLPPADQESTEPNHNTDRNFQAAFHSLASFDLFNPHPLADYDLDAGWGNPVFGDAPDGSSQELSLAGGAGPSEHDVNRYIPADQDNTGLQTSPHYYQQPSPSSNTPSMTDDCTRASSNDPSTPGANELGALDPADAVAHGNAGPLPTTSLGSFGGNHNNGVVSGHIGIQTRHTQPFPNPWQGNLGSHSHSQGLNAAGAPAFWQPGPAAAAPPPPWYTQGPRDALHSSLERPNVAPQGGAHRNNTRSQKCNEPYSNQAAASGADLGPNNMISTGAAPTGGARSNDAGRTTPPHPRTTRKKASPTATQSSTTAQGHPWMCTVKGCKGDSKIKSRGPNNEPILSSKQRFDSHMNRHTRGSRPVEDSKPVICPICKYRFKSEREDSLGRHLKSETACKGKEDAEENDASAPDDHPSDLHKHDDGDDDDDQDFGGMGGMSTGMPQAPGQAAPSSW